MDAAYQHSGNCSDHSVGHFFNRSQNLAPKDAHTVNVYTQFFSPANIAFLQKQLENALTMMVGENVRVPVSDEFAQTMYDVASQNSAFLYMGQYGLDMLNEMVVEWEARIQYVSIRQQKRYDQEIIRMDRILFFPYPEPTKSVRGETVVDTSGYMLTNPWNRNYANAMSDIYKIGPQCQKLPIFPPSASMPIERS